MSAHGQDQDHDVKDEREDATTPAVSPARWLRWLFGLGFLLPAATAFAQQQAAAPSTARYDASSLALGAIATVVYGVIGILLVMLGYKMFEWMMPFSVKKELEEDHNTAVGIVLAALILGICIVVAATIHG